MAILELISKTFPYSFKSLGSNDFPKDTVYVLTEGKFPLTNYKDMFSESKLYHTLDNNITPLKI